MAKPKTKTAAEKAGKAIDAIKQEVKALVEGWQSRTVTKEAWHTAHDRLADLYRYNPAEWERIELDFCHRYEAWQRFSAAQDAA